MFAFVPANIFSDHMILQANKPIRIFGQGSVSVTGSFLGETVTSVPTENGWELVFSAHPYGGGYTMTLSACGETVTFRDISVGEVILFSGQSNIQMKMQDIPSGEAAYIDDKNMRLFQCDRPEAGDSFQSKDGWICAQKKNIFAWSAVAYYFAKLAREKGIPYVGVIICAQGASNIQSWLDESKFIGSALDLPLAVMHHDATHPLYSQWNHPGLLYHFMFLPVARYSVANVVWYQGESNTSEAEGTIYVELLRALTDDWRRVFGEDLPFYIVQIADYAPQNTPGWKAVQKAQLDAEQALSYVHTVRCADFSERDMIHPITKEPLSRRLFEAMRFFGDIG